MMHHLGKIALPVYFWLFVTWLFVPLFVMAAMGFRDSNFVAFPIQSWTADWYRSVIDDREILASLWVSLQVAVLSTVLGLGIGTPMAFMVARFHGVWRAMLITIIVMPAFIPIVVSAIALRMFIGNFGIQTGLVAIAFGHAVSSVPFVVVMLLTRLNSMSPNLADAARDLGADEFIVFFRVVLPYLAPALFGAFMFCMLLSFEDFTRSFFLGSFDPTFPVLLFARLRFGFDPGLAAISTLVLVATIALGLYAERFSRKRAAPAKQGRLAAPGDDKNV
ncbi:ABC transporter permease [Pelagibacterium flavum]|uniref:ABC transporter permease n=1 Tax=Pelagibacterium flavum TaxID=2984530 RepID=A0ABY6IKK3_9HYPH|nr:ABC transporter permease [Pelagibacterium sp. YIM 151497]UYQ70889.1 ABC transporter permease [Pelagibacterium sp. YIM 151497]